METVSKPVLSSDDALYLWQQGREIWNAWMMEHRQWTIDLRNIPIPDTMKFEGFHLPKRCDIFITEYLLDKLDFKGAIFHQTLNQDEALNLWRQGAKAWHEWVDRHPNWDVDFSYIDFDTTSVNFSGHRFPTYGDVYFIKSKLGEEETLFNEVNFGHGVVSFRKAVFGENEVSFYKAIFGNGHVSFDRALLGGQTVYFDYAIFGHGDISFWGTTFGRRLVNFRHVNFGSGRLSFRRANFREADVNFSDSHMSNCTVLRFSGIRCEGVINFYSVTTSAVLNLAGSDIDRVIDFDKSKINYMSNTFGIAKEAGDSRAFRFLKGHAKKGSDHERTLEFFAKEKRAAYWHEMKGLQLFIYCLYGGVSNYGRSLLRPIIGLLFVWLLFSLAYLDVSGKFEVCGGYQSSIRCEFFEYAKNLSASQTLPFLSSTKLSEKHALDKLFVQQGTLHIPNKFYVLARLQNSLSVALLFLVGLAIRNRFRV